MHAFNTYLETGKRKTFVCVIDWPGWCRSGRNEWEAMQALVAYGHRYGSVVQDTGLKFQAPVDVSDLVVVERVVGNATTDFGAPAIILESDRAPLGQQEYERHRKLLLAGWRAFDDAVQQAKGKELRKGPRGGGRSLGKITQHVLESDREYLRRIGWKYKRGDGDHMAVEFSHLREIILEALESMVDREMPERGPRGGVRWPARYFVRRVMWHVLDHAWEIEDRTV